jgi:serine O-acetyltransferase
VSDLARCVREDISRCLDWERASLRHVASTLLESKGLQAVLVYRFGRWLHEMSAQKRYWPILILCAPLYGLAALAIRGCYGISLSPRAQIGAGFYVAHFGGVTVRRCRMGAGCSVGQQTKVGPPSDGDGPEIGDRVWMGAHARIELPVRVGSGVTIAPGARVVRNVPDRSLIVGNPARVVSRSYDNSAILPH